MVVLIRIIQNRHDMAIIHNDGFKKLYGLVSHCEIWEPHLGNVKKTVTIQYSRPLMTDVVSVLNNILVKITTSTFKQNMNMQLNG